MASYWTTATVFIYLSLVGLLCTLQTANASNVTPQNRTYCSNAEQVPPPNRVNTTERVLALRDEMRRAGVNAYMVVMTDEHGSYSGTGYDARVAYISGFTGSNGWAIVTEKHAALWTDGRYFLQADQQMDCGWILMEMATPGYPQTSWDWLKDVLSPGQKLGASPKLNSQSNWLAHVTGLTSNSIDMVPLDGDLVDKIWTTERPSKPNNHLLVHTLNFTGETVSEKLNRTREKIKERGNNILVVTVLEQVAWLFNLRGQDRTSSLFYGYAIVYEEKARLYLLNRTKLLTEDVRDHLKTLSDGTCLETTVNCIEVYEYEDVYDHIKQIPSNNSIWVDPTANQAIYNASTESGAKVYNSWTSPIELMKSIKNPVERANFAKCILRDSAAVVEFAAFLESEIDAGKIWNELTAVDKVNSVRATYENFKGLSFETISAFGPNAAVIHYRPDNDTVATIDKSSVYLLDSGGQYLDGTTDVTRTFHYGEPNDAMREAYTRVLMGQIDLAQTVWTEGMYGYELDIRARYPLFRHGWDYNHGTGHGIGYFLSVHEGPGRINRGYNPWHERLYEGMFFSDEPGYYENEHFGIRLENLVTIVEAKTPNHFGPLKYLTFDTLTLVPYEPKLIKYELLSTEQINWLNDYHKKCREKIGDYLHDVRENHPAYLWLIEKAAEYKPESPLSGAEKSSASVTLIVIVNLMAALLFSK